MSPRLLFVCLVPVLSGCTGFFGEEVRAPVYERDQMVARSGPAPSAEYYTVKPGDTLYSIAWRENMDFHALALWNNLPSDYTVQTGQRLRLEPPVIEGRGVVAPSEPTGVYADLQDQSSRAQAPERRTPTAERDQRLAATPDNSQQSLVRKAELLREQNEKQEVRPGKLRWRKPTAGRLVKAYQSSDLTLKGVHIGGTDGQAVVAAESGRVVYSGNGLKGYGNLIIVKHDKDYLSAYGYNRKILVKEGQNVKAGEKIAEMGRSDKGMPLLHFEIRYKGKPINPASVVSL